jgi:hypothetical protein
VITGTTGGITGGDIIPDGFVGLVKHISHSEFSNTGQNVLLQAQPSLNNLDSRSLAARANFPNDLSYREDTTVAIIPPNNVLQVTTSQGNVVTRVVYVIREGRL